MKNGHFVSEHCEHIMRICPKCGATFCKGECKKWVEAGRSQYLISVAISGHKNYVPYKKITQKELCHFCNEVWFLFLLGDE